MHVNTLLAFVKYADTWYEPCRKDLICPLKAELFYIYCIESNIPLLVPSGRKTHAGNPFWSPDWQFKSHCSPKHEVNQTAVSEVTSCSSWRFIVVDDTIPESMKSDYRAVTKKITQRLWDLWSTVSRKINTDNKILHVWSVTLSLVILFMCMNVWMNIGIT